MSHRIGTIAGIVAVVVVVACAVMFVSARLANETEAKRAHRILRSAGWGRADGAAVELPGGFTFRPVSYMTVVGNYGMLATFNPSQDGDVVNCYDLLLFNTPLPSRSGPPAAVDRQIKRVAERLVPGAADAIAHAEDSLGEERSDDDGYVFREGKAGVADGWLVTLRRYSSQGGTSPSTLAYVRLERQGPDSSEEDARQWEAGPRTWNGPTDRVDPPGR